MCYTATKCRAPLCAATDASNLCEQQPTLRRHKVTNNVDPAESANAGERMRHKLTAISVLAIGTSLLEGAFGLPAARTGKGNGWDVLGAGLRAR